MSRQRPNFLSLPDEIIQSILLYLPLQDVLAAALANKRLYTLHDHSYLWRKYCRTEYRFWASSHNIDVVLEAPAESSSLRDLFVLRKQQDQVVLRNLDSILASQHNRLSKIQLILNYGYDSKDVLRRQLQCPNEAEDVLARRYYTKEILGCLERNVALREWERMRRDPDIPLERALGAFDLFMAQRPPLTLAEMGLRLDMLAREFGIERQEASRAPPRQKAKALAEYLRQRGFIAASLARFRKLENNCISIALCDPSQGALPLICVAVYCCVAQRLGLDARPCGFPERVLAIVTARDTNHDLNGVPYDIPAATPDTLYLDPSVSAQETSQASLNALLDSWGVPAVHRAFFLRASPTCDIVLRTAHNIKASLGESQTYATALERFPHLTTVISPHRASFAARTVLLLLGARNSNGVPPHGPAANIAIHPALNEYVQDLMSFFRADVTSMEEHILPLFEAGQEATFLQYIAREVRQDDAVARPVQPRSQVTAADVANYDADAASSTTLGGSANDVPTIPGSWDTSDLSASFPARSGASVHYRVGTLFRHARFQYLAAISGWDHRCRANGQWIAQMNVDALPNGRGQPFYHVLVEDETIRYVAEENIVPINVDGGEAGEPNEGLLMIAGRCFKRWDATEGMFVSNVRDQYPDD